MQVGKANKDLQVNTKLLTDVNLENDLKRIAKEGAEKLSKNIQVSNPNAFNSMNANNVLDKVENTAEANKMPDMSETKSTLKSAFSELLAAFKGNKGPDLDTSTKESLKTVTDKVEPDRKVEVPKVKDPNKENTGANLMVKAVQKDTDNLMDNLVALKDAKSQGQNNNLQDQNKQLQTQANLV